MPNETCKSDLGPKLAKVTGESGLLQRLTARACVQDRATEVSTLVMPVLPTVQTHTEALGGSVALLYPPLALLH